MEVTTTDRNKMLKNIITPSVLEHGQQELPVIKSPGYTSSEEEDETSSEVNTPTPPREMKRPGAGEQH